MTVTTTELATAELAVLDAFRVILRNPELGCDDDFFEAGGDSLLAVDAAARISAALGQDVDPAMIFMYPTASGCAGALAQLD